MSGTVKATCCNSIVCPSLQYNCLTQNNSKDNIADSKPISKWTLSYDVPIEWNFGHLVFDPSVIRSFCDWQKQKNINLCHNIWTIRNRDIVFDMRFTSLIKPIISFTFNIFPVSWSCAKFVFSLLEHFQFLYPRKQSFGGGYIGITPSVCSSVQSKLKGT